MRQWRAIAVAAGMLGAAGGQTLVDLRTQSKSVDFSAANATKPFKSGTVLPATCTVGEGFFQTNAPAGLNLYGCTAVNSWTLLSAGNLAGDVTGTPNASTVGRLQGRTVSAAAPASGQSLVWNSSSSSWTPQTITGGGALTVALNGTTQGTQATLNFISGTGIVQSCTNNAGASRVDCTPSFNTALIPSHDTIHANEIYCASSNGTTSYTCAMPNKALPVYTLGQTFLLNVDATCASSCSLNVDGLGAKSIKKKDGVTDPAGTLVAGQAQFVWFDGTIIRLMYF